MTRVESVSTCTKKNNIKQLWLKTFPKNLHSLSFQRIQPNDILKYMELNGLFFFLRFSCLQLYTNQTRTGDLLTNVGYIPLAPFFAITIPRQYKAPAISGWQQHRDTLWLYLGCLMVAHRRARLKNKYVGIVIREQKLNIKIKRCSEIQQKWTKRKEKKKIKNNENNNLIAHLEK